MKKTNTWSFCQFLRLNVNLKVVLRIGAETRARSQLVQADLEIGKRLRETYITTKTIMARAKRVPDHQRNLSFQQR